MSRRGPGLQFALFLAAFFALWSVRATWLIRVDRSIQSPETRMVFATLVKVLLWITPAVLFAYWARRADPIRYLGLSVFPKPKAWAIHLLAIGSFCVLILSFELLAGQKRISFGARFAAGLPSGILFFLVSPFVEEVLFRGLILKELSGFMKFWAANILTSLLFAAVHFPYWISSGTAPGEMASASAGILIFSLFAGWLFSLGKSIWPPTAAHIANNILSSLLDSG